MYTPISGTRSTKYGSNYWTALSSKIKRRVQLFSDLEYDHWVLVESDPNVKTFCEQPLKIQHLINGEIVNSVFDMWIQYVDGTEKFIEVKYERDLDPINPKSSRNIRQTGAQQDWCRANNKYYEIRTDKMIRGNPLYLSNLKQIISYTRNRGAYNEVDSHRLITFINMKRITLGEIETEFINLTPQRIREIVCNLIYTGQVEANISNCIIGSSLEVWLNVKTKDN
ncbi:TnsA endonuclease N-terminal domain-containing protein [Paenibacillus profundus]|uniref:TnsA endonuclease N-terminal domain-containing protein n=1 Tax=Paenibacillus profundus TaxID=1173085 RepID=A0ABS8YCE8_9BACL|nr:TnsA endonuclease N-terminal domain-containing protein [Paenibacillus profundus]MCE5169691.1 TnsA endonuclease N-terminal domain-containing protein [Paenibacillus profundus]